MQPTGPFHLLNQNKYFNGWPTLKSDPSTVVMTFPVEDWSGPAAVTLTQLPDGSIKLEIYGDGNKKMAEHQALAAMSLDEDGSGWTKIAKSDEFVTILQNKYDCMRPTLFNSPYEAAAAFIIGHRITITQARCIRNNLAVEHGDAVRVKDEVFHAFPEPQKLLTLDGYAGLSETKIFRLHAVAQAAIEGQLSREYLRDLDDADALAKLEQLPGIGPFFSQGILYRGVGKRDGFTEDDMTFHAIKTAYNLNQRATIKEMLAIADNWRPYRMWVVVLMHVWLRETDNYPKRTFSKK